MLPSSLPLMTQGGSLGAPAAGPDSERCRLCFCRERATRGRGAPSAVQSTVKMQYCLFTWPCEEGVAGHASHSLGSLSVAAVPPFMPRALLTEYVLTALPLS